MTVSEIVRTRLLALSAVTALVGTRAYNGIVPQDLKTFPVIRVQRIDELETVHLRGTGGPVRARVQVDSIALSMASAFAVDAALHGDGAGSGLAGWTGSVGSPAIKVHAILPADVRDGYDADELKQYRVSRDYFVIVSAEH